MRCVFLALALAGCSGPNRTDPSFLVRPEARASLPIALPKEATVESVNPSCGDAELSRAKATLGALARELGKGGFEVVPLEVPEDEQGEEDRPPAPVLTTNLSIRLENCDRGLFGDVALEVLGGGRVVARFSDADRYFSNVAALGADLVDRIAASPEIASFALSPAAVVTSSVASSTVSR